MPLADTVARCTRCSCKWCCSPEPLLIHSEVAWSQAKSPAISYLREIKHNGVIFAESRVRCKMDELLIFLSLSAPCVLSSSWYLHAASPCLKYGCLCDWSANPCFLQIIWGRVTALALDRKDRGSSSSRLPALKPSQRVKQWEAVLGSHVKGLDEKTVNCLKYTLTNTSSNHSQLDVASSRFQQRNGGALPYHLAPIVL